MPVETASPARATQAGDRGPDSGDTATGDTSAGAPAKRRKAPLWATALTVVGAVLTLLSVTGIVGVRYFLGKLTEDIQTTSSVLDPSVGSKTTEVGQLPEGSINLLMLGLDTRTGWEKSGELSRSDTIMVMHLNAAHDQAYMISIPRDTVAHIPADKEIGFAGSTERINGAYAYGSKDGRGWEGGAKLATKAVHELTGIDFDGVMVIDFNGFKGVLEAMGGVHMCVDKDMWSSHYVVNDGKVEYAHGADPKYPPRNAFWFRKGCRDMAPWEALEFSRLRHSANGDYDRQRHQQQLLRAMAKKATSAGIMTNPSRISNIMKAAGSSLKMDTHGVPVQDFIFGLKDIAAADLIPIKTNGGTFAAINGGEGIQDATKEMFRAAATDRLNEFLAGHPEMLINDGGASS